MFIKGKLLQNSMNLESIISGKSRVLAGISAGVGLTALTAGLYYVNEFVEKSDFSMAFFAATYSGAVCTLLFIPMVAYSIYKKYNKNRA